MPGIVFVHGFVCNRAFWNPWMKKLRAVGVPFIAVNLEPVFGSITDYAPAIEEAVTALERVTAARPIIVAHSMGGLATREWMRLHGGDDRVSHVVTIGTPHRGTWLARWGRTINSVEMRLESVWLSKLMAGRADELHAKFTCFYSNCDNIVFPPSTATLPDADNRLVIGRAHVHLAFQADVYNRVIELLDETRLASRIDASARV
jgi:triacylglycerol esterase/lipase EstA (alpha/beta hydrolase family)